MNQLGSIKFSNAIPETIKEYILVSSDTNTSLTEQVNKLIKIGWIIYGDPNISIARSEYNTRYCYIQAMVKY